jgi:hypothetical protein
MIVVKQLTKTTVDVFTGNGWENWSRFERTNKGPMLIAGQSVSPEEYQEVKNVLSPRNQKRN